MDHQAIHHQSLATSTRLSAYYIKDLPTPANIIDLLNEAGLEYMIIGSHGNGGWLQKPRASQDVDVLVDRRQHRKAVQILLFTFPFLEEDDQEVVTHLRNQETRISLIDVIKPKLPLYQVALKHSETIRSGPRTYRIPTLEMALAMKYARIQRLTWQSAQKYLDVHDFMLMAKVNPKIDLEILANLGDLVYPGGGVKLVEKVRQVRAGEKLTL